jgi:hypothetical protein
MIVFLLVDALSSAFLASFAIPCRRDRAATVVGVFVAPPPSVLVAEVSNKVVKLFRGFYQSLLAPVLSLTMPNFQENPIGAGVVCGRRRGVFGPGWWSR